MRRAAILLGVAPLVLGACGGGSHAAQVKLSPVAYVKQAALKTSQAQSERMTLTASAAFQGQKIVMTGDGAFDNVQQQGDLQLHANVGGLDLPIEAVTDKADVYLKAALFQAMLPAGKTWLKIDLARAAKTKGLDLSSLLGQDPTQAFARLQAAGAVTDVGADVIDGVPVEHYRVVSPSTNVWIGKDDGLVRRIDANYGAAGQSAGVLMNFSDFGKDVSITVPPAAQSFDATSTALKGLGG